jgi:hypothetical protein
MLITKENKMIDWNKVYKLSAIEFSENPDLYADPDLIYALGRLRKNMKQRIFPSPVSGALARFRGSVTSQHYAVGRKSTGSDIFCEGDPATNLRVILASKEFKGVGIYLDTNGPDGLPWVMFHVDKRAIKKPLIWVTRKKWDEKKKKKIDHYYYPSTEGELNELLNEPIFFKTKVINKS